MILLNVIAALVAAILLSAPIGDGGKALTKFIVELIVTNWHSYGFDLYSNNLKSIGFKRSLRGAGVMSLCIGGDGNGQILAELQKLVKDAVYVDLAVSYIQPQGWKLFGDACKLVKPKNIRLLCTSQMGITHPAAVKSCLALGVQIRDYSGDRTYHPKVYIARKPKVTEYMLGSANLSSSAFNSSVEVMSGGEDTSGALQKWYDKLFMKESTDFTPSKILAMEAAFLARQKTLIKALREIPDDHMETSVDLRDEVLERLFDQFIASKATTLGFDQAGNTVRNISRAMELLGSSSTELFDAGGTAVKLRSELKLVGILDSGKLTPLGVQLSTVSNSEKFAYIWLKWLFNQSESDLLAISSSGRLVRARNTFRNFHQMSNSVKASFIDPATGRTVKETIEILANVGGYALRIDLETIIDLAKKLHSLSGLSNPASAELIEFRRNKGSRNWESADREVMTRNLLKVLA